MENLVLLCRHGNTFDAGQIPYMVGKNEDLLLTAEGENQARAVGRALVRGNFSIGKIVAAPLKRTRLHAEIVASITNCTVTLDSRLSELDYGEWSGKNSSEIEQKFGTEELSAWSEFGIWPRNISFSPSKSIVEEELRGVLDELAEPQMATCLVTSNGRIKMLAEILKLPHPRKMGTGRVSVLSFNGSSWHSLGWNLLPNDLEIVLKLQS